MMAGLEALKNKRQMLSSQLQHMQDKRTHAAINTVHAHITDAVLILYQAKQISCSAY